MELIGANRNETIGNGITLSSSMGHIYSTSFTSFAIEKKGSTGSALPVQ